MIKTIMLLLIEFWSILKMAIKLFIIVLLNLTLLYGDNKDCKRIDVTGINELILATGSMNLDRFSKELDGCSKKDIYEIIYVHKKMDLLDLAIDANYLPIVKHLLDKYPDFSFDKSRIFRYIDKSSLNYKDPQMLEFLLNFGKFTINIVDKNDKTLLHHILYDPQDFEVKYLLDKGINTTLRDAEGFDALDTAKKWLLFHQNMYEKTPWDDTKKRIERVQKAISMIEQYNAEKPYINLSQYLKDFYDVNESKKILKTLQTDSRGQCDFNKANELTCFITAKELKELVNNMNLKTLSVTSFPQQKGEFGGIGISVSEIKETKTFKIIKVYKGSPAQKNGFQAEDEIVEIDGTSVKNLSLKKVIEKLQGKPNTTISVNILRDNTNILKTLTREVVKIQDDEIVVLNTDEHLKIEIESFNPKFADKLEKILLKKPYKKITIDLRSSEGGLFDEIILALGLFLPPKKDLFYSNGNGIKNIHATSKTKEIIKDSVDIEIIVDKTTQAGSLLFAYSMKKYYPICKIIGDTSGDFGYLYMALILPGNNDSEMYVMKIAIGEFFGMDDKILSGKGLFEVIDK